MMFIQLVNILADFCKKGLQLVFKYDYHLKLSYDLAEQVVEKEATNK